MLENIQFLQGSQFLLLVYIALEQSEIKRALKDSNTIDYQKPALFTEFFPIKRK